MQLKDLWIKRAHGLPAKATLWALAWMLMTWRASALDPQKAITQFFHRAWGNAAGIEQVNSISQTPDGYLWIATINGLFRFDGVTFRLWEPNAGEPVLPGIPFHLLSTKNDDLWVGGVGTLTLLRGGHSKVFTLRNPEERATVLALCEGENGIVWAGTSLGLYKFAGTDWQKLGPESGLPDGRVTAVMLDKDNTLWVATDDGKRGSDGAIAFLPKGEKIFQIGAERSESTSKFARAPDGKIWAAQTGRSVRAFRHDSKNIHYVAPEIRVGSQSVLFDRDGGFWIATLGDGLRRVRNIADLGSEDIAQSSDRADKFSQKDGLSSDYVTCIFEDREGVIWFGTSAGLDSFCETKITPLSVREGLPFDQNLAIAATPDGSIWAGSTPHGFMQISPEENRYFSRAWFDLKAEGQVSFIVYCLYVDRSGDLILGTGLGVAVVEQKSGHATMLREVPDMKTVLAITRDPAGGLWLCDRYAGVSRVLAGQVQHFPEMHREADGCVRVAHTDRQGRIWLGLTTGEVVLYEGGRFRSFSTKDGLFSGQITTILSDEKGQTWVAGKGGISRYRDNRFQTLDRKNGLPFDDLFAGIQDNEGSFWLAGESGILRVPKSELESALSEPSVRTTGELFGLNDGLRGVVRHAPFGLRGVGYSVATKSRDGKLWFATSAGLAVVDPQHIPRNSLPPPVHIEQVIAGGKIYRSVRGIQFPTKIRNCEIDYAGLSFSDSDKVKYRYKLEGYDEDWVEAGNRRQAFYSNLRPRTYQFRVSACNSDGVWNEAGDTIRFIVPPVFYERTWFYFLCGVTLAACAAGAYAWRVHQLKSRQEALQRAHDLLATANASLKNENEERKRAEAQLRRSEAYLAGAQRLSRTGSFGWNGATGELTWSEETFCILGYDRTTKPSFELVFKRVHPDDSSLVQEALNHAKREGKDLNFEHRLLMPDGTIRHVQVLAQLARTEKGSPEFVGAVMDITDSKKSAEALRASEHLARGQLEALTGTLAAISQESEPQKLLEHVLRMIARQLGAESLGVWELVGNTGRVQIVANCEDGRLHLATPAEVQSSPQLSLTTQEHPIWTEFFRTGAHCVIGEFTSDTARVRLADAPDSPQYDWSTEVVENQTSRTIVKRLYSMGYASTLAVPLFVAGEVTGLISIRFKQNRSFRPEELELTRALAHQALLALQLIQLSQQSRQAAVVAERNRMARDIHDTLAQGFTGIIMQLEAAKGATSNGDPLEVNNRIERAEELARESLGEARRSVRALRPRALHGGKLSVAMDDLLKRMTDGTGLNADFKSEGNEQAIPADSEDVLLRITQESLTNTIRHANARNFGATLIVQEDQIQLQLVDDGRGFDIEQENDGFGLIGMRERVVEAGGQLMIRSKPGVGTEVLVMLNRKPALKTQD